MAKRWILIAAVVSVGSAAYYAGAQMPMSTPKEKAKTPTSDIEMVERLNSTRKNYQQTLEQLRQHYMATGDIERSRWVEDELKQYHRMVKYAYRLDIDVPVPTLQAKNNIPEANELFRQAMQYKDKGFGAEYIDNQRRAEILFQRLLDKYPESDKIGDTGYQLGDIYEKYRPSPQYRRSALYFERSYQWTRVSTGDARLRAARIYDKQLADREKARGIYKEILTHDTDGKRIEEARKRLEELR